MILLQKEKMLEALNCLDLKLTQNVTLIVGGGSAMVLAHGFPLGTYDIDAVPKNMNLQEIDVQVKAVAKELNLPSDWLNPWFATFSHTLPQDYGNRLIEVFQGSHLNALALAKEEMLIMKCFAHRQKDVGHAKALIKKGVDIEKVKSHIEFLESKGISGASEALTFLEDIEDQLS